jgi:hypothetical protein
MVYGATEDAVIGEVSGIAPGQLHPLKRVPFVWWTAGEERSDRVFAVDDARALAGEGHAAWPESFNDAIALEG